MDRYPPIAEHGLVGDLQTAALVSARGVVDWFAAPRFDSPSIFAALLDHDDGGFFRLAPDEPESSCRQLYYPDTAVLVTRFMSPDGVGEVLDWMPPARTGTPTDRHTLVRTVRAVRGTVPSPWSAGPGSTTAGPVTNSNCAPGEPCSGRRGSRPTSGPDSPWHATAGTRWAKWC